MKKILTFTLITVITLIALIVLSTDVSAAEVSTSSELQSALVERTDGATITLTNDMTITNPVGIGTGKTKTLDLNGKTLTLTGSNSYIAVVSGTLTVKNGKIVSDSHAFIVQTAEGAQKAILNIEENLDVTAGGCVVFITKPGAILNTSGKLKAIGPYAAIQGNGSTGLGGIKVNIIGGTVTGEGIAVYFPNTTELNISGGEITSATAVYHKSGKLNISGGTLNGIGEKAEYVHNGNGCYSTGDALIIEACDYPGGVPVANITGGTFISKNNKAVGYYTQSAEYKLANEKFIKGGEFSSDVTENLAENLICRKINDLYYIASDKFHKIVVKDVEGGTVKVDKETVQYGDTVKLTVTVKEGYRLESIDITDGGCGDNLIDRDNFIYTFDKDTTITPVFEKLSQEVELPNNVANSEKTEEMLVENLREQVANDAELSAEIKDKNIKIEVELIEKEIDNTEKEKIENAVSEKLGNIKIAKCIDITIPVKDADTGAHIFNLEELKEAITFTVDVPTDLPEVAEGFTRIYYIVRNHNGNIEILDTKLSEDGKVLEFSSDKFSTYAITYKDVVETEKDDTPKTGTVNIISYILGITLITGTGIIILKKKDLV